MNLPFDDNSDDIFKDSISPINTQLSNLQDQNRDYDFNDDAQILKELLLNSNICHKNANKLLDFGINKTTYGPYEFCIQFEARYFINIIRQYYLKLNCETINFIVLKKIIYIYSHIASTIQIITSINTHYMSPEIVKIMEGYYDKELRANFDVLLLLKNLELKNFSKKDFLKISFKIDKNYKKNKNEIALNENNPFYELAADKYKFDKEFNFEDEAIPGLLIIESGDFSFSIECYYAPLELCAPPNIPDYIIHNFIFYIDTDKISHFTQKINLQSTIEISCNKYICNFIVNSLCENSFMFKEEDGAEFMEQNSFNYFKLFDPLVENGTLYKKMITFYLSKQEIDALKILNKKEALLYFYADNKEKYYYSKEIDQYNNITSAIFLKSKENKPIIRDIEDCCLYLDHWEDWLQYLSSILPRACINELRIARKNKGEKYLISGNKKNKKKKNRNEEEKKDENNSIMNVNVIDGDNQFNGLNLYYNDRKGNLSKIKFNENTSKRNIFDMGRGKTINYKNDNQNMVDDDKKKNEIIVNPFSFS